ncbi:hypothetical protein ABIA33_004992 [Streptacidiphilus sp. MAP12-16]
MTAIASPRTRNAVARLGCGTTSGPNVLDHFTVADAQVLLMCSQS